MTTTPSRKAGLLGKQNATYSHKDIRFADIRPRNLALPNLPVSWGHGMDFGQSGWDVLGNGPDDSVFRGFGGCGDCVWAGAAHEIRQGAHEAGGDIPKINGKTTVDQYSAYSGYDAKTGNHDDGSNVRDVLIWRQQKGFLDDSGKAHKIGAFVALEPGNWQMLREGAFLFETLGIGVQFPNSAMDQFNNNQTWSVVAGATIDGGHYVPVVGHPYPGLWTVITWGQRQIATWNWVAKYCDEVWAYISVERYNTVTNKTAEGYKDMDLEQYLQLVAEPNQPTS